MRFKNKNKSDLGLVILLILAPFITMGFIIIGNLLFEATGYKINPNGVNNAVIFAFFGSYLGGVVTLLGVVYTILANKKRNDYKIEIDLLNEERGHFTSILSKLSPLGTLNCISRFVELPFIEKVSYKDISNSKQMINDEKRLITDANIELELNTYILDGLNNGDDQAVIKIAFKKKYQETYDTLWSFLLASEKYIDHAREVKYQLEQKIPEIKNNVIDLNKKLHEGIIKVSDLHINEIPQLIAMLRTYYDLKKEEISKKYNCY